MKIKKDQIVGYLATPNPVQAPAQQTEMTWSAVRAPSSTLSARWNIAGLWISLISVTSTNIPVFVVWYAACSTLGREV